METKTLKQIKELKPREQVKYVWRKHFLNCEDIAKYLNMKGPSCRRYLRILKSKNKIPPITSHKQQFNQILSDSEETS